MTYETTTTSSNSSARDDPVNEAIEGHVSQSTVQSISPLQRSKNGLALSTWIDSEDLNNLKGLNDAEMNHPSDSTTPSTSPPPRANSPPRVGETEVQEALKTPNDCGDQDSNVINNNNISCTDQKGDTSDNQIEAKQVSTIVRHRETQPTRGDTDEIGEDVAACYNPALDTEIRNRLDKLNALSDLINSLELRFDQANSLFRETLKCSTERLSSIAKTLGAKSIRHGRIYHEARVSVEKTQNDCQRACVQFEQANNDHQFAKKAIMDAENKLKHMNISCEMEPRPAIDQASSFDFGDLVRLSLEDDDCSTEINSEQKSIGPMERSCDTATRDCDTTPQMEASKHAPQEAEKDERTSSSTNNLSSSKQNTQRLAAAAQHIRLSQDETKIMNAAKLSEDLNLAINRLIDAENKRRQSEELHLDQANKLMIAQENLLKLEREYGTSIKKTQIYFEEARRFNVRLNSVKSEIAKISEEIIAAKKAYAKTLHELEQFSEHLHLNPNHLMNSDEQSSSSQQSSDDSEHMDKAN